MAAMTETSQAPGLLGEMGDELKREREMRGVSLREISDATKISMRYLAALEAGDAKHLPAPVFVRGFVREYSRYLGINADEAVDRYMRSVGELEQQEQEQIRKENPQLRDYDPTRDEGKLRIIFRLLTALLVIGILVATAWYFRHSIRALVDREEAPPASAEEAVRSGAAVPTSTAAPEPEPEDADTRPLLMKIEFTEPTWIHLLVDGQTAMQETVNTGSIREFEAKDRIEIRTLGNAGGVRVEIDGEELPPLGRSREVIKGRVFERPADDEGSGE